MPRNPTQIGPGAAAQSPPRPAGARERLLDAATDLFYQRGIHAVGIDAVIARAGVAKMSLYNHFKSKDELITAFLTRLSEQWLAAISAEVDRHAGPALASDVSDPARRERALARIEAFFDAVYEWCAARQFRGCPFLNTAAELADAAHPGHAVALSHKMKVRAFLESELSAAQTSGAAALAHQMTMLIDGAISCAVVTGQLEGMDRAKEAAQTLLSAALVR